MVNLKRINKNAGGLFFRNKRLTSLKGLPKDLPKVEILDFQHNHLTFLEGLPQELINVKQLDFRDNNLISLKGLPKKLPNVMQLYFERNDLASLKGLPNELRNVAFLDFQYNKLTSLEGLPQELPKAEYLHFENNKLKSLKGLSKILPKIEILDFTDNPITTLYGVSEAILPNLQIDTDDLSIKGKELYETQQYHALYEYYRDSITELFAKIDFLTDEQLDRLIHEADHKILALCANKLDNPRYEKLYLALSKRYSVQITNEYAILL